MLRYWLRVTAGAAETVTAGEAGERIWCRYAGAEVVNNKRAGVPSGCSAAIASAAVVRFEMNLPRPAISDQAARQPCHAGRAAVLTEKAVALPG